jgi:hypothetical protein
MAPEAAVAGQQAGRLVLRGDHDQRRVGDADVQVLVAIDDAVRGCDVSVR